MNVKYALMAAFVVLIVSITFSACGPDKNTCTYKVTGTASTVNVTYKNANGGTEQQSNVIVPWSYSFEIEGYGDFVYISAQNQGKSGSVTVSILANGNERKSSTSTGAYVIATASGSFGYWE